MLLRVLPLVSLAVCPAAALAQGAMAIPEPGDAALFVLAVTGLIVGRQLSRRAPRRKDDGEA